MSSISTNALKAQPVTLASVGPKMTPTSTAPKAMVTPPAVVLFGLDDGGKAHAAWFSADDDALARKAAELMGLHALGATAEPVSSLAAGLPRGRVFASGRAFTPFVKAATYAALAAAAELPADAPKPPVKSKPAPRPKKAAASSAKPDEVAQEDVTHTLPTDWSQIKVGNLALASEGVGHAWYEVIVAEEKVAGLFVVRWRDSPELPSFVRRREHLALLHADFVAE